MWTLIMPLETKRFQRGDFQGMLDVKEEISSESVCTG